MGYQHYTLYYKEIMYLWLVGYVLFSVHNPRIMCFLQTIFFKSKHAVWRFKMLQIIYNLLINVEQATSFWWKLSTSHQVFEASFKLTLVWIAPLGSHISRWRIFNTPHNIWVDKLHRVARSLTSAAILSILVPVGLYHAYLFAEHQSCPMWKVEYIDLRLVVQEPQPMKCKGWGGLIAGGRSNLEHLSGIYVGDGHPINQLVLKDNYRGIWIKKQARGIYSVSVIGNRYPQVCIRHSIESITFPSTQPNAVG